MSTQSLGMNPNWRGGRTVTSTGYVLVKAPGHPLADVRGYVYEHRLVMAETLGRTLLPDEQVHHSNGVKSDNRPENLVLADSMKEHRVHHRRPDSQRRLPGQSNPVASCACGCPIVFRMFDAGGRPRRFVSGHNLRVGSL